MKLIQRPALFTIATLAFFSVSSKAEDPIPVRVVVITAFQNGEDNDLERTIERRKKRTDEALNEIDSLRAQVRELTGSQDGSVVKG